MIVAIIPARGGSKRIPRKNIKPFFGKPLLAYPIQAALATGLIDSVIVSTDDPEIAETACRFGAETPFMRPADLADDHTPTQPVLDHALAWVAANRGPIDYFCSLYANPFTTTSNLLRGFAMLRLTPDALVVMGVTDFGYPIQRAFRQTEQGTLAYMHPEYAMSRSQDLEPACHDAAQFYWHDVIGIEQARMRSESVRAHPLTIPRHLCQDLDTPEDWDVAEKLYGAFFAPDRVKDQ
ncbi:MAG: pseudaminic acid cytidylyltransferase [Solidesulfovibrio sp.]